MLNIKNLNAFVYVNFLIINVRAIKENAHSNVLLNVIIFQKRTFQDSPSEYNVNRVEGLVYENKTFFSCYVSSVSSISRMFEL